MAKEIERKFLVSGDAWRQLATGTHYRQGYLATVKERTVRIRTIDDKAFLTIKGVTEGFTRVEYEFEIPHAEAVELLDDLCLQPIVDKHRYKIEYEGLTWEVDEFHGVNDGLIVAEVELESEEQEVPKPAWIADEVSDDERYYNANLIANPFTTW